MGPIVLAKDFSFVAAGGQIVRGDWIELGDLSECQNAVIHVHCQTLWPVGGAFGLDLAVETSYDEVAHSVAGAVLTVTNTGSSDQPISSNLEDKVRLSLTNNTATLLIGIVSVWLQLKKSD